jgi:A/G-specific adenine glycosylase
MSELAIGKIVDWYRTNARRLPWREPGASPWSVLVSEVMLQQTPVQRVLPVFDSWMSRWPRPSDLAQASTGEAIRQWGRLGYPRRALRLHAAASVCVEQHGGEVPREVAALRDLPGVGEYTAAAVATFAFHQRHAVLDTNVRRVHARLLDGHAFQRAGAVTTSERRRALELLPLDPTEAATTSVAVMEFGALCCTARDPACTSCPVTAHCAWVQSGRPAWSGPERRGQTYAGTDRQCRGTLLALVRDSDERVGHSQLMAAWFDHAQSERALESLLADGLVVGHSTTTGKTYSLPG